MIFKKQKSKPLFDDLPRDVPAPKKERAELKEWQKEDAKRLEALWLASGKPLYSSQEVFGRQVDIGSAQMVWQYIKGVRPLNLSVVVKFAKGLKCNVYDISPTLGRELTKMAASVAQKQIQQKDNATLQDIFDQMTPIQRQSWIAFGRFMLEQPDEKIPYIEVEHKPIGSDKSFTWSAAIDLSASAFTPPKTSAK
ncbi:MAG: hypothetical protein ACR2IJ_11805 [Fluviibacter sp.]